MKAEENIKIKRVQFFGENDSLHCLGAFDKTISSFEGKKIIFTEYIPAMKCLLFMQGILKGEVSLYCSHPV